MRKLIQKRLKNQKGLTLIELLVVIVILGIIAAIVVPMVLSNVGDAQDSADARQVQLITDAANRYLVDNPTPETSDLDGNNLKITAIVPAYLNNIDTDKYTYTIKLAKDGSKIIGVEEVVIAEIK